MANTGNMMVSVSFPGVDKKPAHIRSLINFMMENSSLYFRKRLEGDNENVFTVIDMGMNDGVQLDLSGNWLNTNRDVILYGKLHYDDLEYTIVQPVTDCTGTINVSLPEQIEVDARVLKGWFDLTASTYTACLVNCSGAVATVSMVDTSGSDPVPITDVSGVFHVYGMVSDGSESFYSIDGDYEFENGVCTVQIEDGYMGGEAVAFDTTTKTQLTGNVKNKYLQRVGGNYDQYSARYHYASNLYIKYDDENNEKFKPIPKPKSASGRSAVGDFMITTVERGEAANRYKLEVSTSGSSYNKRLVLSLYENDTLIGTGSPWQMWYIPDSYTWREVELEDCDLELVGGGYAALSNYITFSHLDDERGYYWFNMDSDVYPFTVQVSGGANEGGEYDITSDMYFTDCNTVLCKANTKLRFDELPTNHYNGSEIISTPFDDIDVTITPVIDGKENKDETIVPQLDFNQLNYAKVNIRGNRNLEYDTQLRTTSFTIAAINFNKESGEFDLPVYTNVYYKVGLCPINNSMKLDDLVEVMKHNMLYVSDYHDYYDFNLYSDSNPDVLIMSGVHLPSLASSYTSDTDYYNFFINLDKITSNVEIDEEYPSLYYRGFESVPKTVILPIIANGDSGGKYGYATEKGKDVIIANSTQEIIGIAYMKLCNTNGTPYTMEADGEIILLKENENEIIEDLAEYADRNYYYMSKLVLAFKDKMIDGGYSTFPQVNRYGGGKEDY